MKSSVSIAPQTTSNWWGSACTATCISVPAMRPADAVAAEHILSHFRVARWLGSRSGWTTGDDVGEGGQMDQIKSMVGRWLPSSSPGETHHTWFSQREARLGASSDLAWRLWSASRGEIDLRGGFWLFDSMTRGIPQRSGCEWLIDVISGTGWRIPCFKKNSFLPTIWESEIYGTKRRLELYLSMHAPAELFGISVPRSSDHAAVAAWLIKEVLPAVRRSLGMGWELVFWLRDYGQLRSPSTSDDRVEANWHFHLVLVPSSTSHGDADRHALRRRIHDALSSAPPPPGCHLNSPSQVHLSRKQSGDARRLAEYVCAPHDLKDYSNISDAGLLRFFHETQSIRRFGVCGGYFKARQLPWIPAREQQEKAEKCGKTYTFELGLRGIQKIHRHFENDVKNWKYRVQRTWQDVEDDVAAEKDKKDKTHVSTFCAAFFGERYSLIARIRSSSITPPDLAELASSRPWFKKQIDVARTTWNDRTKVGHISAFPSAVPDSLPPVTLPQGLVTVQVGAGLAPP